MNPFSIEETPHEGDQSEEDAQMTEGSGFAGISATIWVALSSAARAVANCCHRVMSRDPTQAVAPLVPWTDMSSYGPGDAFQNVDMDHVRTDDNVLELEVPTQRRQTSAVIVREQVHEERARSETLSVSHLADLSRSPSYGQFLASIRTHFLNILGVRSLLQLNPSLSCCRPLTRQEEHDYLSEATGCLRPTMDSFRIDLQLKRTHPFNLEAYEAFTSSFLRAVSCGAYSHPSPLPAIFLERRRVEAAIYNHIKAVKSQWYRRFVHRELPEDVNDRLAKAARSTRKRRLYKKRGNAIRRCAPQHIDLMSAAGVHGVSSDESSDELDDAAEDKTIRVSPIWRSLAFEEWQHSVDIIAQELSKPRVGTRQKPGANPRYRQPSNRINQGAVAPPGLPRNCYNEAWIATLDPQDVEDLHIVEEPYDLTPFESRPELRQHRRSRRGALPDRRRGLAEVCHTPESCHEQ